MQNLSLKQQFLDRLRLGMDHYHGGKIAVPMTGNIHYCIIAAALSELYGKENISAIECPHLATERTDAMMDTIERFCGEHKVIPITMAAADMCNELRNAGCELFNKTCVTYIVDHLREIVFDILESNGYTLVAPMLWDPSETCELAGLFGIEVT